MPYFGSHMSIAGGLTKAIEHIRAVNGQAVQLFVRNQRIWKAKPLSDAEADAFRQARAAWGDYPTCSHGSYLVNLASPDGAVAAKSVAALADELARAERLGIPWHVIHPGSGKGDPRDQALDRLAANLDEALEQSATSQTLVLLENTAGAGHSLGGEPEDLAGIIQRSRHPERLGVCFDTCHAFADGHDLRDPHSYDQVFHHFDQVVGLDRLRVFHVNDTKGDLGSHLDRHEHIGKGNLGLEAFALLVNDPRFSHHPMILETYKDKTLDDDRRNLATLRGLVRGEGE